MANNGIKGACKSTPLSFIAIITLSLILTSKSNAQNISKHYTSSLQDKGVLYFILPQSGFRNNEIKSELTYDITYLTANDTVTLNFSYFDKLNRDIDSIVFVGGNKIFSSRVKKIFIETKKGKWHYRYSSKFSFTDLNIFLNQADKPKIILYTQQGAMELNIKAKTWKKQSAVTKKILTLIKYNQ